MSEEKTILEKIQLDPGMFWLEVTEGFGSQWKGRALWPSDIIELNEIISKQNDWLAIEAQRLKIIQIAKETFQKMASNTKHFDSIDDWALSPQALAVIESYQEEARSALKKMGLDE